MRPSLLSVIFSILCASCTWCDWVQIGSGEFNPKDTPETEDFYHQSGRAWQSAFAFDNVQGRKVLWVGTSDGGLWRSIVNSDGNITQWVPLTDNFPGNHTMGAFLVHRGDSERILVGAGSPWNRPPIGSYGIFRTTNQGNTWTPFDQLPVKVKQVSAIIEDDADATGDNVLAATDQGVFQSTDFGDTWDSAPILSGSTTDLLQNPNHPTRWYAGVSNKGIYFLKSSTTGWSTCKIGTFKKGFRIKLAASASTDKFLYALIVDKDGNMIGVYRTDNMDLINSCPAPKAHWEKIAGDVVNQEINLLHQGKHAAAIACDPADEAHMLIGLQDMAESTNATSSNPSWTSDVPSGHKDQNHFLFRPSTGDVVISNDGGYYLYDRSNAANPLSDAGNLQGINAFELSLGMDGKKQGGLASSLSDPDMFIAGLQDNGVIRGDSAAGTLTYLGGGDGGQVSIDPDDPIYVAFSNSGTKAAIGTRMSSTDSGSTWLDEDDGLSTGDLPSMLINPTPGNVVRDVFTYGQMNTARDRVLYKALFCSICNWNEVSNKHVPKKNPVTHIDRTTDAASPIILVTEDSDPRLWIYSGTLGSMTLSTKVLLVPETDQPDTRANADRSPLLPNTIYYTTGTGRPSDAFVSFDAGANWKKVTGDMDRTSDTGPDFIKLIANPNDTLELFLATSTGVFHSTDQGMHWAQFSEGLRLNEIVQDIVFNNGMPSSLYIATRGRGIWKRTLP